MKTFKEYITEDGALSESTKLANGWVLDGSILFSQIVSKDGRSEQVHISTNNLAFRSQSKKTSLAVHSNGKMVWTDSTQALIDNPVDLIKSHDIITKLGPLIVKVLESSSKEEFTESLGKFVRVSGTKPKVEETSKDYFIDIRATF